MHSYLLKLSSEIVHVLNETAFYFTEHQLLCMHDSLGILCVSVSVSLFHSLCVCVCVCVCAHVCQCVVCVCKLHAYACLLCVYVCLVCSYMCAVHVCALYMHNTTKQQPKEASILNWGGSPMSL